MDLSLECWILIVVGTICAIAKIIDMIRTRLEGKTVSSQRKIVRMVHKFARGKASTKVSFLHKDSCIYFGFIYNQADDHPLTFGFITTTVNHQTFFDHGQTVQEYAFVDIVWMRKVPG